MTQLTIEEMVPRPNESTVLVVDDDADLRDSLRDALQQEGYQVVVASNGQEALELLPHLTKPCGVVLDLEMPVMDGNAFYQAMSAVPTLAEIPVMVLSCHPALAPDGLPKMKKTSIERLLAMVAALFSGPQGPCTVKAVRG